MCITVITTKSVFYKPTENYNLNVKYEEQTSLESSNMRIMHKTLTRFYSMCKNETSQTYMCTLVLLDK